MGVRVSTKARALQWPCVIAALIASLAVGAAGLRPGDTNCNGAIAADDVYVAVDNVFRTWPLPCLSADVTQDGRSTAADVVAAISHAVAPLPAGPEISFLGLAGANGAALTPSGTINGMPIYQRPAGQGFKLVIEGRPGTNSISVGQTLPANGPPRPDQRPDVWVQVSNMLGDGSPATCDGGVPAIHPPNFSRTSSITDALNDLACNIALSTSERFACTLDEFGTAAFANPASQVQFCMQVSRPILFPDGETLLTVVLRDAVGTLGPLRQLLVRIGSGPFPPTSTPTNTPTHTRPPRPPTLTPTFTYTPSYTVRPTASRTPTRAPTATPTPTIEPSVTPTHTQSASPTTFQSHTPSSTPTPTPTLTPSPTGDLPPTATPTRTTPPTATGSPTRSATRSVTRTRTTTQTATRTPTRTASRSPTAAAGPMITFFALTSADEVVLQPSFTTAEGIPVFVRPLGLGFSIVIEALPGSSRNPVGRDTFVPNLDALPDLQIVSSNPLGNGSEAVCDSSGSGAGGVPALHPPSFLPTELNLRTINDLGCRFVDGGGAYMGRGPSDLCTRLPPDGDYRFGFQVCSGGSRDGQQCESNDDCPSPGECKDPGGALQFCAIVGRALQFPPGDTVLTALVLDEAFSSAPPGSGIAGPRRQIIVRVGDVVPTASATPTPTPTRTRTTSIGITPTPTPTRTPTRTASGGASGTPSRTPTRTLTGSVGVIPTPTRTPSRTASRTPSPTQTATAGETIGPVVSYFGLARFEGSLVDPVATNPDGIPIFNRPVGAGFILIVEGRVSDPRQRVGDSAYAGDGLEPPDLQIIASRPLGNGSSIVCDAIPPELGGVPAVSDTDLDRASVGVLNDFGCRFQNGNGQPLGRSKADGCVLFDSGGYGFAREESQLQFCGAIDRAIEFPQGETLLTARLRDTDGNPGPASQIVVRVGFP